MGATKTESTNTWNYRVLAHTNSNPNVKESTYIAIHEVYYADDKPVSFVENPTTLIEWTTQDIKTALENMSLCLSKPILDADNFPDEYAEEKGLS